MRNIVIKLHRAADLSGTMKAMRLWLDDRRCQPHRFTCDHMPGWHVIRVDLSEDNKADALKAQFGGSEEKSGEGTMSKVFRWRLMAEEITHRGRRLLLYTGKAYAALCCANARSNGQRHGAMV
jgi:hypothetical protein